MTEKGYSIIFSIFDDKKGPTASFFAGNMTFELATKIAVKSFVVTGSFGGEANFGGRYEDEWQNDSIIPIGEEKLIVFCSLISIKDSTSLDGRRLVAVLFIAPMSQQMQLYQLAPTISEKTKLFAAYLRKSYNPRQKVTKEIEDLLTGYLKIQ